MSTHSPLASVSALPGGLRVVPGAPLGQALQSTRREWASRLAAGQKASVLPGLMASLFNLCGQAHRLCSQLALEAAVPGLLGAPQQVAQRLRTETAQEHIRRLGLDWPRLLAAGAPEALAAQAAEALRRCPLLAPPAGADPWPATTAWLQDELLHMPAAAWLQQWQAGGAAWLWDWATRHNGWLPELVRTARAADGSTPVSPAGALRVHANAGSLRALSAVLGAQPGWALQPQWLGDCAHTGSWTRLNHPPPHQPLTPWGLLGCRVAELVRLCAPDAAPTGDGVAGATGADVLSFGALPTGEREGVAWVEMARGLLVHRVEVSLAKGDAVVSACNVLAPTEWNFHPQGVVALRMARLDTRQPPDRLERQVRLLMAAFDPCVPFEVVHPIPTTEASHA